MSMFMKERSFVNKILFPAPTPSYTRTSLGTDLIWVPKASTTTGGDVTRGHARSNTSSRAAPTTPQTSASRTPCLFLTRPKTEFLIIFLHGNGEDIGLSRRLLCDLVDVMWSASVRLSILAPEYPGYGVHEGVANESGVILAAESAYFFARNCLEWPIDNIWLFGVSIGSGPAVHLASQFDAGGLILMAAFLSVRSVVQHILGKAVSYLIADRFINDRLMASVICPTLFIHGSEDQLIPCNHSLQLFELCGATHKQIVLPEGVGHTKFNLFDDIVGPLHSFAERIRDTRKRKGIVIQVPDLLRSTTRAITECWAYKPQSTS